MPELPEVEVVRSGLARWVLDTTITAVEVRHPRPVRRHEAGPADFADQAADGFAAANARFVRMTDAGREESRPHDLTFVE